MDDYTIRDCDTGAVVCTGIEAEDEGQAVERFWDSYPCYDGDVYAAPGNWND